MRSILAIFSLSFLLIGAKAQIDTTLTNQLQEVLDNSVNISGNNGVSAFLLMPGGESWTGTAGIGCQGIPISDSTLFHGASTTKMNIAILLLMLAEDGLLDLDDTWHDYVSLNAGFDTLITIRQLLNHTSGIADYLETDSSGSYVTANFNHFFTPQYILEEIVSDIPDFPAGTNFHYSNSNYVLAGLVAEAVSGNPVHTELRARIWEPLGLDHTYFGAYETYSESTAGVWWNFGNGLMNYSDEPTTSMLSFAYGAGNIVSCPADLGLLLDALLSGQLLEPASLDEMLTFVPQSYSTWTAGYGLGIHHAYGHADEDVFGHDGYYTNLTDMFQNMDYGFTLVTMTNTQSAWFGIFNPMYAIIEDYFINLDILEVKYNTDINIFPNPASQNVKITGNEPIDEIDITDVTGKVIYRARPNVKEISVNLEAAGIYFLRIKTENRISTRKLIIQNHIK